MDLIQEQQWGQVSSLTWEDLSPHQWYCFRFALADTETELKVQGVRLDDTGTTSNTITELKTQGVRVEFSKVLVETVTEMMANILVSKKDYYGAMKDYLPWYEQKTIIFDEILKAYDSELKKIEQEMDVLERNMFLDTTVEMLPLHEKDLDIIVRTILSYAQRREQIAGRYRSLFDQTTEQSIKELALAYGNGEIEINTTDTEGMYEIRFIGKGIPSNLDGFKEMLDIVMPAHLGLTYRFSYSIWEDLNVLTWGDCLAHTWQELRNWEGVID